MQKNNASLIFLRELAFMLALMAFTFRALIPIGFMPGTQNDHASLLTICSGTAGIAEAVLDSDGKPAKDHTSAAEQPCGFAVNLAMLDGHNAPALALPVVFAVLLSVLSDSIASARLYSSHSSRAPPAL